MEWVRKLWNNSEGLIMPQITISKSIYAGWIFTKAQKSPNTQYIVMFTSTSLWLNFD